MKTVNCFELYPSILNAKTVQSLLLELFPYMHTSLNDDVLEMYITKEEYVFVMRGVWGDICVYNHCFYFLVNCISVTRKGAYIHEFYKN